MRYTILLLLTIVTIAVQGQSKTTEKLHKNNSDARALFFYNNTLRMINQNEDKEFDLLIRDVEKMKFLMIENNNFTGDDYKKLISGYKSESFEEMMTSRIEGKNFDVYMKDGESKGMVVTVKDSTYLYVLDIVGSIPLNKISQVFKTIEGSGEIDKIVEKFTAKHKH
jgi:hypothetical protein